MKSKLLKSHRGTGRALSSSSVEASIFWRHLEKIVIFQSTGKQGEGTVGFVWTTESEPSKASEPQVLWFARCQVLAPRRLRGLPFLPVPTGAVTPCAVTPCGVTT